MKNTMTRVLLCGVFMAVSMQAAVQKPTVGVIGAGLAGLSAAYLLQKNGYDVTVYEAGDYAGGRVKTWRQGSIYEELGGKGIQDGGQALCLRSLIAEMGLLTELQVGIFAPYAYNEQGQLDKTNDFMKDLPQPTDELREQLSAVLKDAKNLSPGVALLSAENYDLYDRMDRFLLGYEGARSDQLDAASGDLLWWLFTYLHHQYKTGQSQRPFECIVGGNDRLVKALTNYLGDKVVLNAPVVAIVQLNNSSMQLTLGDNQQKIHDKIICAIPCDQMKNISFDQEFIPADQWQAITAVPYAKIIKFLFKVESEGDLGFDIAPLSDGVVWLNKDKTVATVYYSGAPDELFDKQNSAALQRHGKERENQLRAIWPAATNIENVAIAPWAAAYSYFGPGQSAIRNALTTYRNEQVRTVFRPIGNVLFFAGEHAALEYHGTMEGAVASGNCAARMIMSDYK